MGWGSSPNFVRNSVRDYASAKLFLECNYNKKYGEANISQQSPSRSNYAIYSRGDVMCFRMYSTDIIRWCPDGRVHLAAYDTGVTRNVQSHFGPLKIWKDSRINFYNSIRFGPYYSKENYPFESMTIEADGLVHGLTDEVRRVKPGKKKERREIRAKFKVHAIPRILLGEFGDLFWSRAGNEYSASVPCMDEDKLAVVALLTENADHEVIARHLQRQQAISRSVFGRRQNTQFYPTAERASMAAIDSLLRARLQDSGYRDDHHEWVEIKYDPIQTRGL